MTVAHLILAVMEERALTSLAVILFNVSVHQDILGLHVKHQTTVHLTLAVMEELVLINILDFDVIVFQDILGLHVITDSNLKTIAFVLATLYMTVHRLMCSIAGYTNLHALFT